MDDPKVLERMRADWNERAGEDAYYYVAFGRREQDDEEFFASAADVLRSLRQELKRLRASDAALEIGCGPGRLMRPLSGHFTEIHGVDVSDQMIRMAQERLRGTPNAHPHHTSGAALELFPDEKFDFVYSYAVFQHIPSREVVYQYLREAWRVLKTGGILRCQINGLPPHARQYDTWSGVRITPDEVMEFAREHDFRLLELSGIWTQYMWVTCRKMPAGWEQRASVPHENSGTRIRTITNAITGEAVAPAAGPMAALSLWVENLPEECDLNHLTVEADGRVCRVTYIGEPARDHITQVNAALPERVRTGLVPVKMARMGQPLCPAAWVRIMPAGPAVPRIDAIADAVNLLCGTRVVSGTVKVMMSEVTHPEQFCVHVDGREVPDVETFCTDPATERYEFNLCLPKGIAPGAHEVCVGLGKREFPPLEIEVP
ncbi:MAG TPA: class I SAM-dependent methyltransferase [Bryobacteraceae bacterium]|nr:class I SAM-dependent methyltransferase [Bryobacteraceae bacterium]